MNDEIEAKIDVINAMIVALGKVTNVEIRMRLAGENEQADELASKSRQLRQAIDRLRGQVADEWTVDAVELHDALRRANSRVQDRIRQIKKQIDIADSAIKVIGQIDEALAFLKGVVA